MHSSLVLLWIQKEGDCIESKYSINSLEYVFLFWLESRGAWSLLQKFSSIDLRFKNNLWWSKDVIVTNKNIKKASMLSCQNGKIPLSCFDLMRIGSIRDITGHTGCTCILRQWETLCFSENGNQHISIKTRVQNILA